MRTGRRERAALAGAVLLAVLTAGGCGRGGGSGVIQGEVRFRGRPLPDGTITFVAADGRVRGARIQRGLYQVRGVPAGAARVAVESHGRGILPGERLPPKGFDIPARYKDPDHSGLSWNVVKGEQKYDVELRP